MPLDVRARSRCLEGGARRRVDLGDDVRGEMPRRRARQRSRALTLREVRPGRDAAKAGRGAAPTSRDDERGVMPRKRGATT